MDTVAVSNFDQDFSALLASATSPEDAWGLFNTQLRHLGAKSAIYGFFPDPRVRSLSAEIRAFSSHPDEFSDFYLKQGFIDHDPLAIYCIMEEQRALVWGAPEAEAYATAKSHLVANASREFGLEFGITLPVRDASANRLGGFGIAFEATSEGERDDILAANRHAIEFSSALLHARVMQKDMTTQMFPLSPRERECLLWASTGLTNKEIAFRLSISDKTVEHHMRLAAKRLDARNRTHAVARALVFDLITP